MKICLPTLESAGLQSRVSPHFGRAPFHLVVDPDTGENTVLEKPDGDHGHCVPAHLLIANAVNVVLCKGIGRGAATFFKRSGIEVLATDAGTVEEALARHAKKELRAVTETDLCQGHHGHDH